MELVGGAVAKMLHRCEGEISHTCRVKVYPDGRCEVLAAEKPMFRADHWEMECHHGAYSGGSRKRHVSGDSEDIERSRRRAVARIRDYALCSDFGWFVTLTLSAAEIDRYDYDIVIKRLSTYCGNAVQRKGLRYILCTELHKDGALHFHGFFGGMADDYYIPSGTYTGGAIKGKPRRPASSQQLDQWIASGAKEVHNVRNWTLGYSTAVRLGSNYDAAITYVSKYIRKSDTRVGGRWYLSGGDLKLPEVRYLDMSYSDVIALPDSYGFAVPGCGYALWRGDVDDLAVIDSLYNSVYT